MKIQTFLLLCLVLPHLAFQPDQSKIFFDEGLQYKAANQFDKAEESFKKAIEKNPKVPEYHFELSNIYAVRFDWLKTSSKNDTLSEGLLAACQRELEQTLLLDRKFVPAIFNLGVLYKKRREYERAREQFRKVLQMDPKQVNAYLQIASTYEAQGFYDEARDMYKQAKELDYNNQDIDMALEDLAKYEEEDKNNQSQSIRIPPGMFSSGRYQSPYMVPSSSFTGPDPEDQQAGGLPAAGMMMVQQLLQSRKKE